MSQSRNRAQALNVATSLAHLTGAPAAHKLVVNSITEVDNHLPTLDGTLASDADLEHYLNALYRLGRQRHTPNISPATTAKPARRPSAAEIIRTKRLSGPGASASTMAREKKASADSGDSMRVRVSRKQGL